MRPSRSELLCFVIVALAGCKPDECAIDTEVSGEDVAVECVLDDDGRYACTCTVGKTKLEEFHSEDLCALSEDEQPHAAAGRCAPDLDDCVSVTSAGDTSCSVSWGCGLRGDDHRTVFVSCDGATCTCNEDPDSRDDTEGEETGSFEQGDFCDDVQAWQDEGDDDAEQSATVRVAADCGLKDANF